jgi:uncharacterized protein YuzE
MSNSIQNKLNLAEMAQGAFMEQFHRELNQVLANIADPNTDPKKARKITLTMTLKPDENREVVTVETQSKSTLVPPKPLGTTIIIDRDNDGSVVGAELKSGQKGQMYMDQEGEVRDDRGNKVVKMQR